MIGPAGATLLDLSLPLSPSASEEGNDDSMVCLLMQNEFKSFFFL